MALGITVEGTHYTIPQVLSIVDVSDLVQPPSLPTGRLAIIGEGTGLLSPGVPHKVPATQSFITSVLLPGELQTAALMAINPSGDLSGVPELYLLPVNPATQATYSLQDSVPNTLLTLTSAGYGATYNQMLVSYADATKTLQITLDNIVETYTLGTGGTAIADLVSTINANSDIVTATFAAEGTPADVTNAPFAGGSDGTTTTTDWQDAINSLNSVDVQLVCVLSNDATVHAFLATHVSQLKRQGFFGFDLASSSWSIYSNRATNIGTIKSNLASSVGASGDSRMLTPGLGAKFNGTLQPSRIFCAMYAGLAALVAPTKPLTNKHLNVEALEVELDDAEVSDLIQSGVAVPMRNHGPGKSGYVISHQRTTWTGDENLSRVEFSVGRGIDAMQAAVEEELWQFIGEEGLAEVPGRAVFITNKLLASAVRGDDFIRIVSYDQKATRAEIIGTILRVFFTYTPVLPINFAIAIAKLKRATVTANIAESFDISLTGLGGSLNQTVPI